MAPSVFGEIKLHAFVDKQQLDVTPFELESSFVTFPECNEWHRERNHTRFHVIQHCQTSWDGAGVKSVLLLRWRTLASCSSPSAWRTLNRLHVFRLKCISKVDRESESGLTDL
jgi:hypothetical protein